MRNDPTILNRNGARNRYGKFEEDSRLKGAVLYCTRFGTTQKVAESLSKGLREGGVDVYCASVDDVPIKTLAEYDLVCLGSPTEAFSAHKRMKEYLASIQGTDLKGKKSFAFDTRVDWRLSGSAAKYIEHALDGLGMQKAASRESAIVTTERNGGGISGAALKPGEEERFHKLGIRLGKSLR